MRDPLVVGGVWFRARADLRSRWRAAVGTALVVGFAAGIVLVAIAGARRTDSAYPRFLHAERAFDVFVGGGTRDGLERAARLPQVEASAIVASARGVVLGSRVTDPVEG